MRKTTFSRNAAVLLLISLLASCGESTASVDTTAVSGGETTEPAVETDTPEGRLGIDDELGEYDFGGYEFRIVTSDNNTKFYYLEETTGDVVDDAIYARNRTVEERFNCKIKVISDTGHRETDIITTTVAAGEDAIDLICWMVIVLGGNVTNDYFMNWYDIPKINFDKPWWSASNVEHLTYGDYCPIAIGDFVVSAFSHTYCMFYNKTKGLDYNIPDVYETVNNGDWTFDYVINTAKDIYQDLNGNNAIDDADFFGLTSDNGSNANAYMWSFNNPIYKKNKDILEFSMNVEKTASIAEKLLNTFTVNSGFRFGAAGKFDYGVDMFALSRSVFGNGLIHHSLTKLRDLDDDYAILPYPKWDENQKEYHSMVDGSHQVMAVPVTVSDAERVGVITEALCAESYKTVVPAYYDVALKMKGTRDDESIEMLDKILASRIFDFGYIYDNWKGASFVMERLVKQNTSDFASYWASNESAIMAHYNSVIKYFEKNSK